MLGLWLGWSGALWALCSIAFLFLPLVQILGYESAIALNVLVVAIGGPRVMGRFHTDPVWSRFWKRCLDLSLLVLLSGFMTLLNAVWVRNCDFPSGLGFWLIFGVGAIPPVVALGMLCERLAVGWGFERARQAPPPRRSVAIYLLMVVLSLLSSGLWLALQPPLVVYDAFAGFWAVSIYDEALLPWHSHLAFRAMTFLGAALWLHALAFEEQPRWAGLAWVGSIGLLLGLVTSFAGELNIARSRSYTQELLGGRVETEHFVIHYEAGAFTQPDLVLLLADHELRYDELRRFWGIEPREKLHSYIYASRDTRERAMGSRSTMIARVWLREMHLVWSEFGDPLLAHEMAHLMLRDAGRGPLRLASANGIFPLMGLVEGAASAAAWDIDALDDHGWSAAILSLGLIDNLSATVAAPAFWAQPSGLAYTLWSSFSRWLIQEYGVTKFLDAYRDGNLARAYGQEPAELFAAWEEALRQARFTPAEESAAALRFDRPSLLRRSCGRAIAQMEAEASDAIQRRDRETARRCVQWLERHERDDLFLQFRVGRSWELLHEVARARAIYERLEALPAAGTALAQEARVRLVDLAWRDGNDALAIRWLDALAAAPLTAAMERNLWVRRQLIEDKDRFPASYASAMRYLAAGWNYRGLDVRLDLLSAALEEKSVAATWLAYRMSSASELGSAAERLAETLRHSVLPTSVQERFALDELKRWGRAGLSEYCGTYRALEDTTSYFGNATATEARMLRERCEASGLYLDAARRAVE